MSHFRGSVYPKLNSELNQSYPANSSNQVRSLVGPLVWRVTLEPFNTEAMQ